MHPSTTEVQPLENHRKKLTQSKLLQDLKNEHDKVILKFIHKNKII